MIYPPFWIHHYTVLVCDWFNVNKRFVKQALIRCRKLPIFAEHKHFWVIDDVNRNGA